MRSAWLVAAIFALAGTPAFALDPPARATSILPSGALFTDDDLVLVEVRAGPEQVTDALSAYSSRAGFFVPLGEIARLLDLAITVYPPEARAGGWILKETRTVSVDLKAHAAKVGDQTFEIGADQAAFHADEIYVRLDLMQKLLPIDMSYDPRALLLTLKPREPLPFQQRLERERRRAQIGVGQERAAVMRVATPYTAFTPPSFDVDLQGEAGRAAPKRTGEYELRAAGDLAYAGLQAFVGSDSGGRLAEVRATLSRKDPNGGLLGPVHGTKIEAGDTFTPSLALGERSAGGRGVFFTSASLADASVFSHLDLRGELPVGYEVELYVNEVLQGSQATPIDGRYEFLNVPLSFGVNAVRLVFYGPHGEQREEVRRFNFGAGQLDKGKLVMNLGAVQEGEDVFPIRTASSVAPAGALATPVPGYGQWRAAAELQYGLTPTVTVTGGFAQYTPDANDTRRVVEAGLRTSIAQMAIQLDAAKDVTGGEAEALNIAGRLRGVTFLVRDNEYQGVFRDETQSLGASLGLVRRDSEIRLDWTGHFLKDLAIPASLDVERAEKQDGASLTTASARLSTSAGGYLLSSNWTYSGASGDGGGSSLVSGALEATRFFRNGWQVRGGLQYQLAPALELQTFFLNLDRRIASRNALRLSFDQSFAAGHDTNVQVVDTWSLRHADLSVSAGYDTQRRDFRVGLQLTFGVLFDPAHGGYRLARPGAASGGDVAFQAFVDSVGTGQRTAGEPPVPDLEVQGQGLAVKTDAAGEAILTGLGDGASARIRVNTDTIDQPFAVPPAEVIEIVPRPGRVAVVAYGLKTVGEVQARILVRRSDGTRKGVSALDVQLVSASGQVVAEGRTEFDGTLYFEKLSPGNYALRIAPEQAARLGLKLVSPVIVKIPQSGGFAGTVDGEIASIH